MALNRIVIMGRLGSDVTLRHTESGTAVSSVSLAVDRDIKSRDGEKKTDWIDVVAFGNSAEFAAKYLSKGRMAVVEGRLQLRDWTDREGNRRRSAEVVAEHIYFGDSRRGEGESTPGAANAPQAAADAFTELDDDGPLPF